MNAVQVYDLAEELASDPEQVMLAQALTLDDGRPDMGLKGSSGLYGSPAWWSNIKSGKLPTKVRSGVIQRLVRSGMDGSQAPNSLETLSADGEVWLESIYTNSKADRAHYQVGRKITFRYVVDELKERDRNGEPKYHEFVLEVVIDL
jgi:hypothetical protein